VARFGLRKCVIRTAILFCLAWFPGLGISAIHVVAEDLSKTKVEGYVTSVHLPTGFDVNGKQVILTPETIYLLEGGRNIKSDSAFRDLLRVDAYVYVLGSLDGKDRTATAKTVVFRNDLIRRLSGLGVITKVVSSGADPVFLADGYMIRINSSTEVQFHWGLKSLAEICPNDWLRYEGKRDKDGVLVATSAHFLPPRLGRDKAKHGVEEPARNFGAANAQRAPGSAPTQSAGDSAEETAIQTKDGSISAASLPGGYKVAADPALHSRIQRVGMRLVPAYQKQLSGGDPSKIDFRFYAVDEGSIRREICPDNGLILIPLQLVERLKSDDQVAAILADGMALNLQRQGATMLKDKRILAGLYIGFGAAGLIAGSILDSKKEAAMEEQRGRIALALLAEAGYDPWQAPEAWRFAAPKRLPPNPDALKYPRLSGYELGILHLQYRRASTVDSGHL
jgi:hypothetical protein